MENNKQSLIITPTPKLWINTNEFSPVALGKEVCNAHPKSLEMRQWVKIQLERIKNGYSVGGQYITGDMYFFLNFYKLVRKKTKTYENPMFLDFQAEFCNHLQMAREQHKGMIAVKRRQVGFSELMASIVVREFWFNQASQILMAADGENQIKPLIKGTTNFINELNKGVFKKNLRVNTPTFKKLGYQLAGETVWRGQSSELHARNFTKGNVMVAVGMAPSMVVIDEAGKAKGLIDFYKYIQPAITDMDGVMTGLPILFGATGEMEDSYDLNIMFYEPDNFNMLAFQYEGERSTTGFFVEGWRMLSMDADGNSDKEKGTAKILADREKAKSAKDERALLIEISQFPLTPAEAFLDKGVSIFNTLKIKEQIENLAQSDHILNKLELGDIENVGGKWQFFKNGNWERDAKDNKQSSKGRFLVYEHPEYIDGKIPNDMYIIGADPIHLDLGTSMGAIYVFKRMVEGGETLADLPVCEYLYRPSNPSLFAQDVLKLCQYYNAVAMVEPSTSAVKDYFWQNNMLHRLAPTPRIATNLSKGSQVKYGFPINAGTKSYVIGLVSKYIDDHIENIFFPRLLKEMLDYNSDGNFDLIMAFAQVLAYRGDLWDWRKTTERKPKQKWRPLVKDSNTRELRYKDDI